MVHGFVMGFFSTHLSGMVNGLTHVIALAGDASAVATALMFAVLMPKYCAISVETALPCAASRYTQTRTRFAAPEGSVGKETSAGPTDTVWPMTLFACAVAMAWTTIGPVAERSSQLSNASEVAPASAPASAAFCA